MLRENVNDEIAIQLYSSSAFTEQNFLGEVKLLWKSAIETPDIWAVSQEFALANVAFKKEISKQVSGKIAVQLKWIPPTSKYFKGKLVQKDILKLERPSFKRTIVEKGTRLHGSLALLNLSPQACWSSC